ncbi:glycosyltransferase family 2 protein [Methanobacterium sp. MBAC-LM]|uniref:glycosyltransferase family 2 protein n=1 Tax=Methanobacterium sp. MBAC-LM TaxID=3412034 RepID=UPI003C785713
MNPKVSIIILNWNRWKDTIECLESIYQINYSNYEVILVDNSSADNSIEKIKEYCKGKIKVQSKHIKYKHLNKPIKIFEYTEKEIKTLKNRTNEYYRISSSKKITLIKNNKNYGFAGGNNIGIRFALNTDSQYILLLNNDTIVDPDFLAELIKTAQKYRNIGSIQSLLLKPDGKIIDSLGQEIYIWSAVDKGINSKYNPLKKDKEIFGACAAAAVYPKEILKKIGLFDENFFVIFEDVDLSWRIRLKGFKSVLAVNSIVYHKRGISESINKHETSDLMEYHYNKNLLSTMLKYYPLSHLFGTKNLNKTIFYLKKAILYSLRVNKTLELNRIILSNIWLRISMFNHPLLYEIQKKWIIQ